MFKYVTARGLRGKWGGNRKRYAPAAPRGGVRRVSFWELRSQPSGIPGRLGLAAMGRSSDFLNVMWLARRRGKASTRERSEECERPEGLLKRMTHHDS